MLASWPDQEGILKQLKEQQSWSWPHLDLQPVLSSTLGKKSHVAWQLCKVDQAVDCNKCTWPRRWVPKPSPTLLTPLCICKAAPALGKRACSLIGPLRGGTSTQRGTSWQLPGVCKCADSSLKRPLPMSWFLVSTSSSLRWPWAGRGFKIQPWGFDGHSVWDSKEEGNSQVKPTKGKLLNVLWCVREIRPFKSRFQIIFNDMEKYN